nr:glycosyltransferase [Anaerolineae bacterium]
AGSLFGPDWRKDPRWRVFYCAIDLKPFKTRPASFAALKASLGLPAEAFVVGHVGRFFEQKNHRFLIDIAAEAARRDPQVYFLLVGDGPLRPEIEQRVAAAGLAGRVIFTGVRQDVPQLMQMMDVFLLPSLYEGLALVTIEAQAAGMPMLLSDTITPETQIVAGLPHFMALTQPATAWAEKLLSLRAAPLPVSREQALATVLDSPFNIEVSVKDLEQVYRGDAHLGS